VVERVLFVDLENVQKIDLTRVQPDSRVLIFYGATQKALPEELVVQAQPFGTRLRWIKMSGHGHNALDFHIAFYLGQELAANPASECTVLSRDTGFDPLMRHLASLGHSCSRVSVLQETHPRPRPAPDGDPFARLVMLLRKDKALPLRPTGLAAKVKSWFPRLEDAERLALVHRLFAESLVQESGTSLSYRL
jgi:hypothetical protein